MHHFTQISLVAFVRYYYTGNATVLVVGRRTRDRKVAGSTLGYIYTVSLPLPFTKMNRTVEMWRLSAGWKSDGVAVTSGGKLQCQKIFHLYAGRSDVNAWKAVIGRCFAEADAAGIKSLAMPPVGTGRLQILLLELMLIVVQLVRDQMLWDYFTAMYRAE